MTSTKKTKDNDAWRRVLAAQWRSMCHLASRPAPRDDDEQQGAMSIPYNLSRAARGALFAAMHIADETGVFYKRELQDVLGLDREKTVREVVTELERAGLVRRIVGSHRLSVPAEKRSAIRITYSAIFKRGWQTCAHCPRPVVKGAEKPKYCATCMATIVRHDRTWKSLAFEVWAAWTGTTSNGSAALVYKIHAQTGQPLFSKRGNKEDDERGKEGVVPWMISQGLIDGAFWADKIKASNAGEEGEG